MDLGSDAEFGEVIKPAAAVAILDAGAQYGGLIDRNVRELGVRSELLPLETPAKDLLDCSAIIISGGPSSVQAEGAPVCDAGVFELGKPVLGICYGMQLMAHHLGGEVATTALRQDGPGKAELFGSSRLFSGIGGVQEALMSHGDSVTNMPAGFVVTGVCDSLVAATEDPEKRLYGTQFHPEVFQTENGARIFRNFLFDIAELTPDYSIEDQEQEAIDMIREQVGDRDVILFLSGGVDSTVLSMLVAKSIEHPERVHAYHIDNGFMRSGESRQVVAKLRDSGIDVQLLYAGEQFRGATTLVDGVQTPPLRQVNDPQIKRRIIGDTFAAMSDHLMETLGLTGNAVLAQGTLRPDLIESGSHLASARADTIKTHHNDTEIIREMRAQGLVIEPLQQLYKDQVRQLGRRLGLPDDIVDRHPFPGPGLAIRILCAEAPYRTNNYELIQHTLDRMMVSEGFSDIQAHLLPVQTVGVQGDGRSYKYLVGLEGPADWQRLSSAAATITNNVHTANRVCYVFGSVERDELGITPTRLEPDVINQLRQADAIVTHVLRKYGLMGHVSQMPVVSFPVNFGMEGGRSIALRPFKTPDFMTGLAVLPTDPIFETAVLEMVGLIESTVPDIARVVYDLSNKPPGTTEWE